MKETSAMGNKKEFEKLDIDGAYITEIMIESFTKLTLTLLKEPPVLRKDAVVERYDVQFYRLFDCRLSLHTEEHPLITSHKCYEESDFLQEFADRIERSSASRRGIRPYHFQFHCREGTIDILAEHFNIALTQKIQHMSGGS